MSGVYVQTGPAYAGLLLRAWVQGETGVRPARRIYRLVSITTTYPNGLDNPVLVYNWVTEGGDMERPWHTPDVPTLTLNPPDALTSNESRVTLQSYQDHGDKREWSRIVEYVNAETGDSLEVVSLGRHEVAEIRSWPESGTKIKARARFQSNAGSGEWSAFSNTVTTFEVAPFDPGPGPGA
ncbi:MAG TPA: hypothetical protein VF584_01300 [Longimicrobium sp.]|jgi:hypothetical protein